MKSRAICSTFLLNKNATLPDSIRIRLRMVHQQKTQAEVCLCFLFDFILACLVMCTSFLN